MEELIKRINQLANKAKTEGLTATETEERDALRRQYIDLFKQNLRSTLDNTTFIDENGEEIYKRKSSSNN